jgi:methionine-rich copper-binding protein CopC
MKIITRIFLFFFLICKANAHTNSVGFTISPAAVGDGYDITVFVGSWHQSTIAPEGDAALRSLRDGGTASEPADYTIVEYGAGVGEFPFTRDEVNSSVTVGSITLGKENNAEIYTTDDIIAAGFTPGTNYFWNSSADQLISRHDGVATGQDIYNHQWATITNVEPGTYKIGYRTTTGLSFNWALEGAVDTVLFTVSNDGELVVAAPPSLSSSTPADNATDVSLSANIELTFSEVVDVETGNITIYKTSGNTLVETIDVTSAKVTGSGTTTITVNPDTTLDVSTEYYVLIDATAFDDADGDSYAGISSTTALSFTTIADATGPTMTITAAEGSDGFQSDDATLSLTFTSNEATSNFAVGDITVSNGTLSDFNASSSTVYTATLTPIAAGEVTIDVAAGTFTDAATNNNLAATQFNWTYGIDPTTKADVIGTIESMSNSSINFTRTSIRSVRNRLDWLERNGSKNTSNQGIKVSFKNPILNTILNNTKDNSYDIERLVYNIPIKDEYSKVVYNPLSDYLFSELNTKVNSVVKENTNIKIANLNPQGKALIQ